MTFILKVDDILKLLTGELKAKEMSLAVESSFHKKSYKTF